MTGFCFSLIEQDVSVFFVRWFQLSVEGVVPIRRLMCCLFFHIFFVLDSMEWARTIYFAVLFPHCSSDVCFLCFVVCFGHHVVLCFVCRCVRPAERRVLSGTGHSFFSVSAILFFLSFCMKIFYICISLFLLFISFFFSFRCFSCPFVLSICLDGSSLSFRFFLVCSIPSLSTPSFFSILYIYTNIDFLSFICFLTIVYKDIKKCLFLYV